METEVLDALNKLMKKAMETSERLEREFLPLLTPISDYIAEVHGEGEDPLDPFTMAYICCCLQIAATRFGAGLVIAMGEDKIEYALQQIVDGVMQQASE